MIALLAFWRVRRRSYAGVGSGSCQPDQPHRVLEKEGRGMMKRALVLLLLALPTVVVASPAAAARVDVKDQYVACLSATRSVQVSQLLRASSAAAANLRYHALIDDDRCFARVFGNQAFRPEDVAISQDMLRGKLAEQALLAEEAQATALQPLPLQQKRYIRNWFEATGRHPAVDEMAVCMADTDPAGILALIHTEQDGSDETAAIGALSPSLTKCLSAGTRLDASRHALRAALADALYQRLSNPSLSLADLKGTRQ
jgi:hypothetical protein